MKENTGDNFGNKFAEIAGKIGGEIHLQALRDTFAILMPFFVLAGLGTLLNSVLFPYVFSGSTLEKIQIWGNLLNNATLNICGLLVAPISAYTLARHKNFTNAIGAAAVSIAALITFMPVTNSVIPIEMEKAVVIPGAILFKNLGTQSMFAGVIVGLLVTEIFMKLAIIITQSDG